MKKINKILMYTLLIFILSFFLQTTLFSRGTPFMTTITNKAVMSGLNISSPKTNNVTTNVQRIVGANWIGTNSSSVLDRQNITAGGVTNLITFFTNLGNSTNRWIFGVVRTNYSGTLAGPWAWVMLTNNITAHSQNPGIPNRSAFTLRQVAGDVDKITFRVYISNGAVTGTAKWVLSASNLYLGQNDKRYFGDGNTGWFGGSGLIGYGTNTSRRVDLYSTGITTDWWVEFSMNAPRISISKSIFSIATGSASAPDNIAIPGATVTFRIFVTNTNGGGNAGGIIIRDYVNTNLLVIGDMTVALNVNEPNWATRTNRSVNPSILTWSNTSAGNGMFESGNSATLQFTAIIK